MKDLIPRAPTDINFYPIATPAKKNNRCHENQNSRHSKVPLRNLLSFFKDQIANKSKIHKMLETCK